MQGKNNTGGKNIYAMPNLMVKLGMSMNLKNGISLGVFNSYFGKSQVITLYDSKGNPTTKDANPEAKPYNYMTLNAGVNFKKLFHLEKSPDFSLNCYVTNVLDEKIYYKEVVRRNINSLPGRAGRAFYTSLTVLF